VVEVAGGNYPSQTVELDESKTSDSDVVFRPAPGAEVSVSGNLHVYGRHIEFRDMSVGRWQAQPGARDLMFKDMRAGLIFVTSASDVSVIGGEVGPEDSADSQIRASNTSGAPVPSNILIDGVDFHDFTRVQDPSAHVECLQFGAGENVTIRNSRFRNCETQGLFIRSWGGTARIRNFLIENNFFDATTVGFYPLRVSTMQGVLYENIDIRYNSGLQPFLVDDGAATGVEWVGNLAPRPQSACYASQTFRHNVWNGADCSPTDQNAAPHFVDPQATDLHLLPSSPAIGAGDPNDYPATDIDGQPRDTNPDAGADENTDQTDNDTQDPPPPQTNATPLAPLRPAAHARFKAAVVRGRAFLVGRWLRIGLACRARGVIPCRGVLRVRSAGRRVRLGGKRVRMGRGTRRFVRIRLRSRGWRLVRRARRVSVRVRFVVTGEPRGSWRKLGVRGRRPPRSPARS
jgi:hypothetical protein